MSNFTTGQQIEQKTVLDGFYQVILDENTSFVFRVKTNEERPGQQVMAVARRYGSRTFASFLIIQDGCIVRQTRILQRPQRGKIIATARMDTFDGTVLVGCVRSSCRSFLPVGGGWQASTSRVTRWIC